MNEHEEEIKLLKAEIDLLKKELKKNKENDDKRHKEIKEIQKAHHGENLHWNKIGALATPITLLLPFLAYFFKSNKQQKQPKQDKELDFNKSLEKKLDKIISLLENK
jgi:hypothetical protein